MKQLLCFVTVLSSVFALDYSCEKYDDFTKVHLIVFDPNAHDIIAVKANDSEEGSVQTVLEMAIEKEAIAAINGGFSSADGTPRGILKCSDVFYGLPFKPRGAVGWDSVTNTAVMDRVLVVNDRVIPQTEPAYTREQDWEYTNHIVGGAPMLIHNGEIIEDFSPEQTIVTPFLTNRFSRAALGILEDGNWVFIVVEANQNGLFGGMTMNELAMYMQHLDCMEALNLSGGHSSSLVYNGELMNKPYGAANPDKEGRRVSDCILVFSK